MAVIKTAAQIAEEQRKSVAERAEHNPIEEGASRSKAIEEGGQMIGEQGRADDGRPAAPTVDSPKGVPAQPQTGGYAPVETRLVDSSVIVAKPNSKNAKAAEQKVVTPASIPVAGDVAKDRAQLVAGQHGRLGFDPGDSTVKRPGDPGVAVHVLPGMPAAAGSSRAQAATGQKVVGTVVKR